MENQTSPLTVEAERAVERSARLRRNMLVSAAARGAGLLSPFLSVPIAVHILGKADYGVWITLSAAVTWFMLLDVGLTPSLRNRLAESFGRDEKRSALEAVSSVFFFSCVVALVMALLAVVIVPWVTWSKVFNSGQSIPESDLRWAVGIVIAGFVLRFPLGVIPAIYHGYQEADRASLWDAAQAAGTLLGLAAALLLQGGLLTVAIATTLASLAVTGMSAAYLFGRYKPWLRPTTTAWSKQVIRNALSLGIQFTVIQIAGVVTYGTDTIVIAQVLGPTSVTLYNLAFRLFWLPIALQSLLLGPLWSAYTEAVSRGDLGWVKQHLRRSVLATAAVGLPLIGVFIVGGNAIIKAWTQTDLTVPNGVLVLLGIYTTLYLWQNCFAILLNGLGSIGLMSRLALVGAPLNLLLCIWLGKRMGLEGIVLANVLTMLIGTIQGPTEVAVRLRRMGAGAH
jgi:O-antigen/teichoic acid export membrane protein